MRRVAVLPADRVDLGQQRFQHPVGKGAQPRPPFVLGFLSQADDARYSPQVLQKGFPDAPAGRSATGRKTPWSFVTGRWNPFQPIDSTLPGVPVSEHLPRVAKRLESRLQGS